MSQAMVGISTSFIKQINNTELLTTMDFYMIEAFNHF